MYKISLMSDMRNSNGRTYPKRYTEGLRLDCGLKDDVVGRGVSCLGLFGPFALRKSTSRADKGI